MHSVAVWGKGVYILCSQLGKPRELCTKLASFLYHSVNNGLVSPLLFRSFAAGFSTHFHRSSTSWLGALSPLSTCPIKNWS
jgi:hypothetical protein